MLKSVLWLPVFRQPARRLRQFESYKETYFSSDVYLFCTTIFGYASHVWFINHHILLYRFICVKLPYISTLCAAVCLNKCHTSDLIQNILSILVCFFLTYLHQILFHILVQRVNNSWNYQFWLFPYVWRHSVKKSLLIWASSRTQQV